MKFQNLVCILYPQHIQFRLVAISMLSSHMYLEATILATTALDDSTASKCTSYLT